MKVAIIDLGTNTFNLLITDISAHSSQIIYNNKLPVKLGEGGIHNKTISKTSFQRGLQAMETHHQTIKSFGVKSIYAFATSAIRSAENGTDFVQQVKAKTGIAIQTIDGDQEAELIYRGIKKAVTMGQQPTLIMDIGGGSTEFIIGNEDTIFWQKSFPLGVSRLKETFQPADPVRKEDIKLLEDHLNATLQPLFENTAKYQPHGLIGSSGSFESFADMIYHEQKNQKLPSELTQFNFKMEDLKQWYQKLLLSNYEERLQIPGLVPMRADLIVIAGVFIDFIIRKLNIKKVTLSTYALKEGVLEQIIEEHF